MNSSQPPRRPWDANALLITGLLLFGLLLAQGTLPTSELETRSYSALLDEVRAGRVTGVEIAGETLRVDGTAADYTVMVPSLFQDVYADLRSAAGERTPPTFGAVPVEDGGIWLEIGRFLLPVALIMGLFLFLSRRVASSQANAFGFGRSKARLADPEKSTTRFTDVAGVEEAKGELAEVVEFLKYPERFEALGARIPKGVLLYGPPGTGKTLLARAVAGEAGVPFLSISGSEFVEMFVGVGASRVRDLFERAKAAAPAILFIDELDAIGRSRGGAGFGGSNDEREQTLNQILVEMDGFEQGSNVIVIGATNRVEVLDGALLRPGRFDRRIGVDLPDRAGRQAILEVHAKGKPLKHKTDLAEIAARSVGLSGADLANLLNEAAIGAARRRLRSIEAEDLAEALERVIAGPSRTSRPMSESERRLVAIHEGGHAIVGSVLAHADTVRKVTIVGRGRSLGYTLSLPGEDQSLTSRRQFEDRIATLLAGNAAESLVTGEVTTGSSNDIERATALARAMVTRYGMSERLGTVHLGLDDGPLLLGRDGLTRETMSEATGEIVDLEIRALLARGLERAKEALQSERARLDALATALLEHESLDGDRLATLLPERQTDKASA